MTTPGEFTYRRVHQATPELLFDCMTQPEHLTHFWGPTGTTTPVDGITVDLRPGGAFETTMVSDADGNQYTMHAVYVEVRRPAKLVWTESDVEGGMTTTITFTDLGTAAVKARHPPGAKRSPTGRAVPGSSRPQGHAMPCHLIAQHTGTTPSSTLRMTVFSPASGA